MTTIDELGEAASNFNPQGDKFLRIVQNWGNEVIANMRNNLRRNNALASKNLYQQIEAMPTFTPQGANLKIQMLEYWQFVEYGRRAGKMPPVSALIEYVQNKRELQTKIANARDRIAATKSLAYVIARKIGREGTKAQPFVQPALTQQTLQTLSDRLGQYLADSITAQD